MKNIKIEDKDKKYNWPIFSFSYLDIAILACKELLDTRDNKHSKETEGRFPYKSSDLFIAIMFNVKHGIELFTKSLGIFAYGEYSEGHDIKDIFTATKQRISTINFKPTINGFDRIDQSEINQLPSNLSEIENLVNYFYSLEGIKDKIQNRFSVYDIQNDIFRYPTNKALVHIQWDRILHDGIDSEDISSILNKTSRLRELFGKTGYLLSVTKK